MIVEGGYGRFGELPRRELERFFHLDDEDRRLVAARRRNYNRLGFAVQLVTVRHLGMFLPDPLDVPPELVDYLAEQLGIDDASCVKRYTDREKTKLEHAWEIQRAYGLTSFADVEAKLRVWIADQAWMTGDGPKAILQGAVAWLRERQALLPLGITTLQKLVAAGREAADQRLWTQLAAQLTPSTAGSPREAGMNALGLPTVAAGMLAEHAAALDTAYREVASRLDADTPATIGEDGKLHVAALVAVPDPASLVDLRRRVEAMLPRVDLPELVLEVMSWHPGFTEAFTHTSGNDARVADLGLSVAAVLCAHAMNVGFGPVTGRGVEALTRDRLLHVDQCYVRSETLAAANAVLVDAQAEIGWPKRGAVPWSLPWTGCGSSSRSAPTMPGRTRNTSAANAASPG